MTPPAVQKKLRDKRITDEIRQELKRPWGKIYSIKELIAELQKNTGLLISVGDITTSELIRNDIIPDVSFIDYKFKRIDISNEERDLLNKLEAKTINIRNPSGIITSDLMEVCEKIFSGKVERTKVLVEGEEDLAALATAFYAPIGSTIAYGQPDEGAVLIHLTEKYKKLAEKYYKEAESV